MQRWDMDGETHGGMSGVIDVVGVVATAGLLTMTEDCRGDGLQRDCCCCLDGVLGDCLAGDDALTLTGTRTVDHWENGFGRGAFAGHAFSLGVRLTRGGNVPGSGTPGEASGQID